MIRDLFKWVAPGVVTVLGGTTLCLAMTSSDIASDLTRRSTATLASEGLSWAELSLDGRDIRLAGTTADQIEIDRAVQHLMRVPGVRSITPEVTLAPMARPYSLVASLDQGVVSLNGGVPNGTMRKHLFALAGSGQGTLDLRSGVPDRRLWAAGVQFAINQLQHLDSGEARVSDLTISFTGHAKSERALGDFLLALDHDVPAGISLGRIDIAPPVASPYSWTAKFDGKRIAVSGHVPDHTVAELYRTAALGAVPVSTGLSLASGQPADFEDLSRSLIEQLSRLEYGEASIIGDQGRLTGAAPTLEIAQAVVDTLSPSGSIVVLDAPRIADYWMSATRQPGGIVVFDGYAPDEATRQAFGERQGADISYLKLGRGAPERYQSGVDFALDALALMSEGRISLRDTTLTITGTARSAADYEAVLAMLAGQAPQGFSLAQADIKAPRAEAYSWSVTKSPAGALALAGLVPNAADRADLLNLAGPTAEARLAYASGEPADFLESARTAIGLLQWLSEGSVRYDGQGWTITGTAATASDKGALEADFLSRKLAATGWSMAVADPVSAAQAPLPAEPEAEVQIPIAEAPVVPDVASPPAAPEPVAVDPDYSFAASRTAGSGVVLSGQLPSDSAMQELAAIVDGDIAAVSIADGAPQDFLPQAQSGLRALLQLSEGQLNFAQGAWSLRGTAADEAVRDAAVASIGDPANWVIEIQLPAAPEVVTPVPPVASAPAVAVDIAACSAPVAEFSSRNAILFQSGAALIAAQSEPALDELAGDLAVCPDAVVYIEGHTDSDGDDSLNMALSVARAEAVVNALITRGVTAARLYAVGYGETAPIADNSTSEGKRLNRRIVVSVQPKHF